MWRVKTYFEDLQDSRHPYKVGDTYPREGLTPDAARIFELSTDANQRGIPLIEEVQTKAEHVEQEKAESVEDVPVKRKRKSTK